MCGLGLNFSDVEKKSRQQLECNSLQTFFLEVKWEDGLPSIGDPEAPVRNGAPGPSLAQSLHFSPLEEPIHRAMLAVSKGKREWGGESRENCFFLFLFKHVAEQSQADV